MQTKLDEVVHELFPSGLRFEGERVTLTKQMRTALNGVAEVLLEHKQVLRVNIEAYIPIAETIGGTCIRSPVKRLASART